MNKEKKRLSIDLPLDLLNDIKVRSVYKNITLTKWLIGAIIEQIKKEEKLCK